MSSSSTAKYNSSAINDVEQAMKRRNEELERALRESAAREEKMRVELEMAWERARVAEEGEEMLCFQLGELEAEAIDQAREFQERIKSLVNQLQPQAS